MGDNTPVQGTCPRSGRTVSGTGSGLISGSVAPSPAGVVGGPVVAGVVSHGYSLVAGGQVYKSIGKGATPLEKTNLHSRRLPAKRVGRRNGPRGRCHRPHPEKEQSNRCRRRADRPPALSGWLQGIGSSILMLLGQPEGNKAGNRYIGECIHRSTVRESAAG